MKINILGLGESLAEYKPDGNITIGVNDIFKFHKADYLVVIDPPNRFAKCRLLTILNSKPRKFFTHYYNSWRPLVENLQTLTMSAGYDFKQLDKPGVTLHSNNSVFVACVIAYKMGATDIVIYGADFNTHPNFKENELKTTLSHFETLHKELKARKVCLTVCSSRSALSSIMPVRY